MVVKYNGYWYIIRVVVWLLHQRPAIFGHWRRRWLIYWNYPISSRVHPNVGWIGNRWSCQMEWEWTLRWSRDWICVDNIKGVTGGKFYKKGLDKILFCQRVRDTHGWPLTQTWSRSFGTILFFTTLVSCSILIQCSVNLLNPTCKCWHYSHSSHIWHSQYPSLPSSSPCRWYPHSCRWPLTIQLSRTGECCSGLDDCPATSL